MGLDVTVSSSTWILDWIHDTLTFVFVAIGPLMKGLIPVRIFDAILKFKLKIQCSDT
jgi:hypothetical protein